MIKSITIVGSGRWAKQYIVTLLENKLTKKIIVISKTNISKIKDWVFNNNLQKYVTIKNKISEKDNNIAIVVNLASEHYKSTSLLIKKGYNVLVEKPLTLNFLHAKKIYENSKISNVYVACSNIFLFSSYISKFSKLIRKKKIKNVDFIWHDKFNDTRYGEKIRRDEKISLCFDILPHIFSMLNYFNPANNKYDFKIIKKQLINNNFFYIKFKFNDFECSCNIQKDAKKRSRVIIAKNKNINLKFDFSDENSIFLEKNSKLINRLDQKGKSSLYKMLKKFLTSITTRNYDKRINLKNSVYTIKLIEKILK